MASYYTPVHKSIKWYRKVVFELLLNTAIVKAHVMHNQVKGTSVSIQQFRIGIIKYLTKSVEFIYDHGGVQPNMKKKGHKLLKKEDPSKRNQRMCKSYYKVLTDKFDCNAALNKAKKVMTYSLEYDG